MRDTDGYTHAKATYGRISALYPRVRQARAFRRQKQVAHAAVRAPGHVPRIDRDLAILSLATKAITTHAAAIQTLTHEGFGADGMALGRVLLENVICSSGYCMTPDTESTFL
ncbi:MAG: hypothetical protein ABR606_02290 [Vicinamibacterales bacterium]